MLYCRDSPWHHLHYSTSCASPLLRPIRDIALHEHGGHFIFVSHAERDAFFESATQNRLHVFSISAPGRIKREYDAHFARVLQRQLTPFVKYSRRLRPLHTHTHTGYNLMMRHLKTLRQRNYNIFAQNMCLISTPLKRFRRLRAFTCIKNAMQSIDCSTWL